MDIRFRIGLKNFFFARARAYRVLSAAIIALNLFATAAPLSAHNPEFTINNDNEQKTRDAMGISGRCSRILKQAAALAMVSSEGAWIDLRIKSKRGAVVLEGLRSGRQPKTLDTELLGPYKNHPMSYRADLMMMPGSRYPLAVTIAAVLVGDGDLVFQKGDYFILHADAQLFAYKLPEMTIPSGGSLRLFLGSNDKLYYNAELTHPVHAGPCGRIDK